MNDKVRAALYEAKTLLADLRLGQSIQNERFPDRKVEGPLWDRIDDVVRRCSEALASLEVKPRKKQ